MELNEVKKLLYKEKPNAMFCAIKKGMIRYDVYTKLGHILFEIPISDIGDAEYKPSMPSQLLIRYIVPSEL